MPITLYHQELHKLIDDREGMPFSVRGVREYTKRFRVVMTNRTADSLIVCSCPGLPIPYSSYYDFTDIGDLVYDLFALMVEMRAEQDQDDEYLWIVTCKYSTEMPEGGKPAFPGYPTTVGGKTAGGAANNPELEPPDINWDFEEATETVLEDLDGQPYTNSANQPFLNAPPVLDGRPVLTYTRNELYYSAAKASEWGYTVNSLPFLGFPINTVLCMPPTARMAWRGPLVYWRVTYKFKVGRKYYSASGNSVYYRQWQPRILDAGTCRLDSNPASPTFGQPMPIFLPGGVPASTPQLLNGLGQQLKTPGTVSASNPAGVKAVYRDFRQYQGRNHNQLLIIGPV